MTEENTSDYETEKDEPNVIHNPLCECLGKLIVFAIVKDSAQAMLKCENYDNGCRQWGSMGFVKNGTWYVQCEEGL